MNRENTMSGGTTMKVIRMLVPAAVAAGLFISQGAALAASPEKGKAAYMKYGCWQCHGTVGQGAATGTKLSPDPMPLPVMQVFIRNTKGTMPPYQKEILPDDDLADIHAYLQSIPRSPDYKSIPLLNQ